MATLSWPSKEEREKYEVEAFIAGYALLGLGRLGVEHKGECPDYLLRDLQTGAFIGVELTSVYIDDRSVPDVHMLEETGPGEAPTEQEKLRYYVRFADKVAEKVCKARKHYGQDSPLYLSIYVNEYLTFSFGYAEWQRLVKMHEPIFDDMAPFEAIMLTNLPNERAGLIVPASTSPNPSLQRAEGSADASARGR